MIEFDEFTYKRCGVKNGRKKCYLKSIWIRILEDNFVSKNRSSF